MKIYAINNTTPGTTMEQIGPLLKAEAKVVWSMYEKNILRELYFRLDRPGVVVVLECDTVEDAKKYLEELPLMKENLIVFDYIPVGHFSLFAYLFEKE